MQSQMVDILAGEKAETILKLQNQIQLAEQLQGRLSPPILPPFCPSSVEFPSLLSMLARANEAYSQIEKQRQLILQLETNHAEMKGKLELQAQKALAVEREQQELGHQTTKQQSETSELKANNAELLQKLSIQASDQNSM